MLSASDAWPYNSRRTLTALPALTEHFGKTNAAMTSTLRVSDHKRGQKHNSKAGDGKPREETDLRCMYDSLRRGDIVSFPRQRNYRRQLMDFYGMDIDRVEPGRYKLIGEWDGPYYIPVERIVSSLMEPV